MKNKVLSYSNVISFPQFEASFFHRMSYEYINACEELEKSRMRYSTICYYLVCHALEIAMKSYLILDGWEEKKIRNISHNLKGLMKILKKGEYYIFTKQDEEYIIAVNKYYSKKDFEYLITAGEKLFPNLKLLKELTWSIIRDSDRKIQEKKKLEL